MRSRHDDVSDINNKHPSCRRHERNFSQRSRECGEEFLCKLPQRHIEYKWISCFPYPFLFRVVTKRMKTVQKKDYYLSKNSNLQIYEENIKDQRLDRERNRECDE